MPRFSKIDEVELQRYFAMYSVVSSYINESKDASANMGSLPDMLDQLRMDITNKKAPAEYAVLKERVENDLRKHNLFEKFRSRSTKFSEDKRNLYTEMQQVLPNLWIGPYMPANDKQVLEHHGITHLCTCLDMASIYAEHFQCLVLEDVNDAPDQNIVQHFEDTNAFIDEALTNGGAVLIHCAAGISRSASVTCAYLIWKFGMSYMDALHVVQRARSFCQPNSGFHKQLEEYSDKVLKDAEENAFTKAYYERHPDRRVAES